MHFTDGETEVKRYRCHLQSYEALGGPVETKASVDFSHPPQGLLALPATLHEDGPPSFHL